MSKVFLSYDQDDEQFVNELYHRLTRDGVECFFDKKSVPWGAGLEHQVVKGLEECDFIVPILTPGYCRSQWPNLEQYLININTPTDFAKKLRPLLLKDCQPPPLLQNIRWINVSTNELLEEHYPGIRRHLGGIDGAPSEPVASKHPDNKFLPLSISTFPQLINGNYLYVDKTRYMYNLVVKGGAYFLSRPRRFGKSLAVSTLKEIFLGNRELFNGLWIYNRIRWEKYPVIHLDFLKVYYKEPGLQQSLSNTLDRIAEEHGIQCHGGGTSEKFDDLIRKLAKDKPIVILIDEYDKPITDYIEDPQKAEEHREILKNFYSVLKSQQENIRFLFMTGVTRFSRLSIFSDLNHLADITFHKDYVQLLGYTETEIETNFDDYIQKYAGQVPDYSKARLFKQLKEYYDGYSWDGRTFVYNPISITHFFEYMEFKSFWFATGTPTFLVRMARMRGLDVRTWEALAVKEQFFDKFDISNLNTNLLLFQTGYLTIKKQDGDVYTLSYPNREVENAFLYNLLEEFSGQGPEAVGNLGGDIKESLEKQDIQGFINKMKAFLAAIPHPLVTGELEKYYHLVFYLILKPIMGKVNPEHFSNRGRSDLVVETDKYIYLMEFKMEGAEKALKQINHKGYYEQYLAQSKKIILMGIGFNKEKRNISTYLHSEIQPGETDKYPD